MMDGIRDGDLYVFEKGEGQVDDVVLVQRLQKFAESGGAYVIKRLKENRVLVSDNEKENRALYQPIDIYNTRRLHEKCGYKTPKAFREAFMKNAA